MRLFIFVLCLFFLSGCYTNGLYVQEEWVDREFLASSQVSTPDPRQKDPPKGQRLLIAWDLPRSIYRLNCSLMISVWFWDNTFEEIFRPIERRRGVESFFFSHQKILTYRVQVVSGEEVLRTWEHHLWTKFIKRDSVSSQPMQESVMETP